MAVTWSFGAELPQTTSGSSQASLAPGQPFGPYRDLVPIGEGSHARVYRARGPEGEVALKLLKGTLSDQVRARFRREGELAARLTHPGFVRLLAGGEVEGVPFLAYELVAGEHLRQRLGSLSLRGRAHLIQQAAAAVGYAHAQGVVHRDLKAENLLVDAAGRVRVADLGLALVQGAPKLSATGEIVGTPRSMSPEQAAGEPVGPATDVWALGALLYECLTGERPVRSTRWLELRDELLHGAVAPPRQLNPGVPGALEDLCLRALARDPAQRFRSGSELASTLDSVLREGNVPDDPHLAPALQAGPGAGSSAGAPFPLGPLGRFELLEVIGRGAMGIVYRALDPDVGREVALKFILSARGGTRLERFKREGQVTAALSHPGVLRVHGTGVLEGTPYLVYELVEDARTLDEAWEGRSTRERVEMLREVALALGHAHQSGVVHRDVKPENVLVAGDGRVLVADFGLAAAQGADRLTKTGALLGTPHYMAPEQISGSRDQVGPATDVWALGVMLYEVLTGERPFVGGNLVELGVEVTSKAPPYPRSADPNAPRSLGAVCVRALEKDPGRRYADAGAFAADLEACLRGQAPSASTATGWVPLLRRRGVPALLLVPALALLGAIASALVVRSDSPPPQAAPAVDPPPAPAPAVAAGPSERWLNDGRASWREIRSVEDPVEQAASARAWLTRFGEHPLALEVGELVADCRRRLPLWILRHAPRGEVRAVFGPDGKAYCFGSDRTLSRWDASTGQLEQRWRLDEGVGNFEANTIVFAQGGALLGTNDRTYWLDLPSHRSRRLDVGRAEALAAAPDGSLLAIASFREVQLWRPGGEGPFARTPPHPGTVKVVVFTPDGQTLVTFCGDKEKGGLPRGCAVTSWDVSGDAPVLRGQLLSAPYSRAVAMAPDGKVIAAGTVTGSIVLFDPLTAESTGTVSGNGRLDSESAGFMVGQAHNGSLRGLVFSPDGALLYSISQGAVEAKNELRVWDVATHKEVRPVAHRPYQLEAAAISPDGSLLLIASEVGVVEVWAGAQ